MASGNIYKPDVTVVLLNGPTLSRQISFLFFSSSKLACKLVCLPNFDIELAYVPSTHHQKKNLTSERMSIKQTLDKERCKKNSFISNYVVLLTFSSPVKFSKTVFRCEISCKV